MVQRNWFNEVFLMIVYCSCVILCNLKRFTAVFREQNVPSLFCGRSFPPTFSCPLFVTGMYEFLSLFTCCMSVLVDPVLVFQFSCRTIFVFDKFFWMLCFTKRKFKFAGDKIFGVFFETCLLFFYSVFFRIVDCFVLFCQGWHGSKELIQWSIFDDILLFLRDSLQLELFVLWNLI